MTKKSAIKATWKKGSTGFIGGYKTIGKKRAFILKNIRTGKKVRMTSYQAAISSGFRRV